MGDAERDIFWLGTALQSLLTLGNTGGLVKGRDNMLQILGETIATLRRIEISGNLFTELDTWSNYFRENYAENEHLTHDDKEKFITSCKAWIQTLSDR